MILTCVIVLDVLMVSCNILLHISHRIYFQSNSLLVIMFEEFDKPGSIMEVSTMHPYI
jgi:hypothetical protein